jgi:hypothetical protein
MLRNMTIDNDDNKSLQILAGSESYKVIYKSQAFLHLKTFAFHATIETIQPDAQFLFSNLTSIVIKISAPNASSDSFNIFSFMPKLECIYLRVRECSITKFPDLLKLRSLSLVLDNVEVSANAFDHLTGLKDLSIRSERMGVIETGLAPTSLKCIGDYKVLKLNSMKVSAIEDMTISFRCKAQIESLLPLVGLRKLTIHLYGFFFV